MSQNGWMRIVTKICGPQFIALSVPPEKIVFCNGAVSLNVVTEELTIGTAAPFKLRDFANEMKIRKSNGGGGGLIIAKQIIAEKMRAELRTFGFTNEEMSKLKLEVMQNILASCCADPVPGFECVPACDLTSPAHRKDVIEFFSLPVEDLGEGITLDSLFPPEEIAALRARGYTDDAIFELTRKQACEILGIET